ncbi:phosphopantetheine-binding protein [Nonomuraea antimicrobica]|uniref:Phosphopantetheine-binding protein n=1 Tax=Nonomuraea antimicrobica TaxID=561173 RepID=A0ABP7EBZ7_9ACTN
MQDDRAAIREFVARHVKGHDLSDDQDIFASGYVSSLFVVQIVMFTENTMGVTVSEEDLDLDNFLSISRIHDFVTRKRNALAR